MIRAIRKSLGVKVSLAVLLILVLSMGVLIAVSFRSEMRNTLATYRRSAELISAIVENGIVSSMVNGRHHDVQRALEDIGTNNGMNGVLIFDEDGLILSSSKTGDVGLKVDPKTLELYRRSGGAAASEVEDDRVFSFTRPIYNMRQCFGCHSSDRKVNGVLNVRISLDKAYADIAMNRIFMLRWGSLTLLCVALMEILLLRRMVGRPVEKLRDAMVKAENGDEFTLNFKSSDEMGDLSRSFKVMLECIGALGREAMARENDLVQAREAQRAQAIVVSVMDGMPDGVAILDRELRIGLMNPRYSEIFPDVRIGEPCYAVKYKRDDPCPHCSVVKVFEDGKVHEHYSTVTAQDGSQMVVHSISAPIKGSDGSVTSVVEVVRDVTEKAALENELKDKTLELEKANKRLSRMAVTDGLTMLFNHRYFQESLKREFKRLSRKHSLPYLSLAMIDIDRFKDLNDAHGHLAGDEVLRGISRILKDSVRLTDVVARYGGEEFAVIMPETDIEGTGVVAERMRAGVESAVYEYMDARMKATVSIGVASYPGDGIETEDDLIKAADAALYRAKQQGRNKVIISKGAGKNA